MKTVIAPQGSVHTGSLILINQQYPCQEVAMERSLVPVNMENNEVLLERRAVALLSKLMDDIDGWTRITAVSGWRSKQEQQDIFTQSLAENGRSFTEKFVAKPGHSEHQTGLAIDLGLKQPDMDFIRPSFPYEGICQTFREKVALFGFIERYPEGKEEITGIGHEPWHFRYVGMPHAAIVAEMGFTLEEYHDFLKQFPYGKKCLTHEKDNVHIAVSYMEAAKDADTSFEIAADIPYSVSGNNVDGFVITEWRYGNGGK